MENLNLIKARIQEYREILTNTEEYRKVWKDSLKETIIERLKLVLNETELDAEIEIREDFENLEAVVMNLGITNSGISERINDTTSKQYIKSNGSLIYQQLFNGKVLVIITYPFIEGMSQTKPPKNIEILRPEELKPSFILRHIEKLLKEVIEWEDYDDDVPQKIGFNAGFIKQNIDTEQPNLDD